MFWEEDDGGRKKGRRLKKRSKIEAVGRKLRRSIQHFQPARVGTV
jgi:hypothetical protein